MINLISHLTLFLTLALESLTCFLDNDYFYGGSMRDLSNRHTGRRKSSSVSHIGEYQVLMSNIFHPYSKKVGK